MNKKTYLTSLVTFLGLIIISCDLDLLNVEEFSTKIDTSSNFEIKLKEHVVLTQGDIFSTEANGNLVYVRTQEFDMLDWKTGDVIKKLKDKIKWKYAISPINTEGTGNAVFDYLGGKIFVRTLSIEETGSQLGTRTKGTMPEIIVFRVETEGENEYAHDDHNNVDFKLLQTNVNFDSPTSRALFKEIPEGNKDSRKRYTYPIHESKNKLGKSGFSPIIKSHYSNGKWKYMKGVFTILNKKTNIMETYEIRINPEIYNDLTKETHELARQKGFQYPWNLVPQYISIPVPNAHHTTDTTDWQQIAEENENKVSTSWWDEENAKYAENAADAYMELKNLEKARKLYTQALDYYKNDNGYENRPDVPRVEGKMKLLP